MKKMLVLAMTMAMVLLAAAGVCETLRVGMECNYAPYNWTQSDASENAVAIAAGGYADGYDVRIAKITGQMSTFHYDMIDQIEGAVKMPAMETFPTMIVAVSSGAIDGYVADRPGAVSATSANPDLTYVTFDEGQGFTVSPDDAQIAVGVRQGSELKEQINEILAGISAEERNNIMDAVVLAQPLSE